MKRHHIVNPEKIVINFFFFLFADPPEITLKPKSQQVRSGGVVAFYCAAQGDPNPSLYWKKNGKRVSESHSRYQMMNFTGVGISLLRIETVRSMRDNATYECIAENGVGDAVSSEATLIVHDGTYKFCLNLMGSEWDVIFNFINMQNAKYIFQFS